jgi:hypothetical protein
MVDYMDIEPDLRDLNDPRPYVRGPAAYKLRDSFDERIGDMLIRMLIEEQDAHVFMFLCMAALPKWIVRLEHALAPRPIWPIGSANTVQIVRSVRGMRLPSYEQHLPTFFKSDDWAYKLAAIQYCHEKKIWSNEAKSACDDFLGQQSTIDLAALARVVYWGEGRRFLARVKTISYDLSRV